MAMRIGVKGIVEMGLTYKPIKKDNKILIQAFRKKIQRQKEIQELIRDAFLHRVLKYKFYTYLEKVIDWLV